VDNLLHTETPGQAAATGAPAAGDGGARPKPRAQYEIGETVKVISGPLSDFSGEIAEINDDAAKLKVLVSIFGRETPVEVGYDQVKKV
jgi:transcriptional antiterminator NusG